MRPFASACLLVVPALAGCGAGQSSGSGTHLTISAVNSNVGRSEFHVDCDPPGGDLPDPAKACAAIDASADLVTSPKPFTCAGGTFSWWDVRISGRLEGKPVDTAFSTCWTTQMATIEGLGIGDALDKHLLPRRHEEVFPGTTHVFPPGALDEADLLSCDIRGHHLEMGVPTYTGQPGSVGYDGANIVGVTLTVTRREDGSVEASCQTDDS